MLRKLTPLFVAVAMVGLMAGIAYVDHADAQPPAVPPARPLPVVAHHRGYKLDPVLSAKHHAAAKARHDSKMKRLPKAAPTTYDCRQFGYVPPIKDQGQCGSCYQFSGADVCEMAFMRVGLMPVTGGGLAEQYGMDCQNWGGCNGGDEAQVIDWCKTNGLPSTADYGPYTAQSGNCSLKPGTKLWQIQDWGYCAGDQGQGVATVQEIKNAMVQYGPISVAVDASGFDSYTGGILTGTGHNIDHAVILIGWDDAKGGGAWLLRNQWGTSWGEQGYMWIAYGAFDVGTEAIWVNVNGTPVPPPGPNPPPVPPSPIGDITVTIPAGTAPGRYTVGAGGLTPSDTAALQAARDAIDSIIAGNGRSSFETDAKVKAQIAASLKDPAAAAGYAKVANHPLAHAVYMFRLKRDMGDDPAGKALLASYKAGALPAGWLQSFLDYLIKNGPALMNLVQEIMKMFVL